LREHDFQHPQTFRVESRIGCVDTIGEMIGFEVELRKIRPTEAALVRTSSVIGDFMVAKAIPTLLESSKIATRAAQCENHDPTPHAPYHLPSDPRAGPLLLIETRHIELGPVINILYRADIAARPTCGKQFCRNTITRLQVSGGVPNCNTF